MIKLTFLWHLHQPRYRTADGQVHAPWVLLHAAGEYLTLVHALRETGLPGQVLNLTPVFLEQLFAYAEGRAKDPFLQALKTPARDLTPEGLQELVRWAFLLHPRQLARFSRLLELAEKVRGARGEELPRRLGPADITDLQVLAVLAYAAPNARWEELVASLVAKGSGFSPADQEVLVAWLESCPGKLLGLYRSLAATLEIATSPYAHPLLPLLLDTQVAAASVPKPVGGFPFFASREDAAAQIREGLGFMQKLGFKVAGCWPPEGAVSPEAVALYGEHGVRWLATDEGILAASLGHPVSGETGVSPELCSGWSLDEQGPVLFFRHRELSDFIGFKGQHMPEDLAAQRFSEMLAAVVRKLPEDAGLLVALDGENPWSSYPDGGGTFLLKLAEGLEAQGNLRLVSLQQRLAEEKPLKLPRLFAGSWIGASFATWIGHEEKCRAWELLARCREAGAHLGGESWLVAQGSDWWWWFGDDNPTLLAPLYDRLFRWHLADALRAAGKEPLPELAVPVRRAETPLRIPTSRTWPAPVLDGKSTSYFEWVLAQWVEAEGVRFALWADGENLWLRVDPSRGGTLPLPVVVTLASGPHVVRYELPADRPGSCACGTILETSLPRLSGSVLMVVEASGVRLPPWGSYRLEFFEVDEP